MSDTTSTYCGNYPDADHTNCPSSVECYHATLPDVRGACPATGRSAAVCADQSHLACWAGRRSSIELDRKVEAAQADR